jgi:riboflavin kinase/FMN adenylyltransferase
MRIYRQLDRLALDWHAPERQGDGAQPMVATIGNFDGVHLGHRSVIAEVIARARALGGESIAITFDPHPARVLRPEQALPLITPLPRKLELLEASGIDAALVLPFTEEFCHMSARQFASSILVQAVHATEVHEGENFRFGYRAEAGIGGLEELGRELGFSVLAYAPRSLRGGPISSSRIRALIAAGQVSQARALLGRPFDLESTPAPGRGYGTRYAVPTINLAPYADLLPANGVYVTTLTVGTGEAAETFEAVTNVGNRPTFGADSFAVESHLLNFHPIDLTEETPLRLTFLRHLREERKWPDVAALRAQIALDVARARRYFALCGRKALTERT